MQGSALYARQQPGARDMWAVAPFVGIVLIVLTLIECGVPCELVRHHAAARQIRCSSRQTGLRRGLRGVTWETPGHEPTPRWPARQERDERPACHFGEHAALRRAPLQAEDCSSTYSRQGPSVGLRPHSSCAKEPLREAQTLAGARVAYWCFASPSTSQTHRWTAGTASEWLARGAAGSPGRLSRWTSC